MIHNEYRFYTFRVPFMYILLKSCPDIQSIQVDSKNK